MPRFTWTTAQIVVTGGAASVTISGQRASRRISLRQCTSHVILALRHSTRNDMVGSEERESLASWRFIAGVTSDLCRYKCHNAHLECVLRSNMTEFVR